MIILYVYIIEQKLAIITHTNSLVQGNQFSPNKVSLVIRYIPDIQRDFNEIKQSQEARGIGMSKDVSLPTRIKSIGAILFPLIFSSMERIVNDIIKVYHF